MRVFLDRVTNSDPTTFVTSFAVWAMCMGVGLVVTNDFYALSPSWVIVQHYIPNDTVLGWMMLVDSVLLLLAVRFQRESYRTVITLCSSLLWGLLGMAVLLAAYRNHIASPTGLFCVWCSLQGLFAVGRWTVDDYGG